MKNCQSKNPVCRCSIFISALGNIILDKDRTLDSSRALTGLIVWAKYLYNTYLIIKYYQWSTPDFLQ